MAAIVRIIASVARIEHCRLNDEFCRLVEVKISLCIHTTIWLFCEALFLPYLLCLFLKDGLLCRTLRKFIAQNKDLVVKCNFLFTDWAIEICQTNPLAWLPFLSQALHDTVSVEHMTALQSCNWFFTQLGYMAHSTEQCFKTSNQFLFLFLLKVGHFLRFKSRSILQFFAITAIFLHARQTLALTSDSLTSATTGQWFVAKTESIIALTLCYCLSY